MKKAASEQQELAHELYLQGKKYQEIADEVGVTLSTVKSWATRYWKKEKLQPKEKKSCKKVATEKVTKKRKRGGQPGNKNGKGPPGNKNAEKHGFFSKVLPKETLELINDMESLNPLDILWQNIQIQYAAILRAQQLMYVKNKDDKTKEVTVDGAESSVYNIQYAWDKQANFMSAQSRSMTALNAMIKQYDELLKTTKTDELQQARIELLRAQVSKLKEVPEEKKVETIENDTFSKAIKASMEVAGKVWEDEDSQ